MQKDKRAKLVIFAFALFAIVGIRWGLPGVHSWSADSISPRSCGLFAIAETYLPGHFHTYPPLHMAIMTVLSLPWIAIAIARVGTNPDVFSAELIKPLYMTGIEFTARIVAAAMGMSIVASTMRLWRSLAGDRVAIFAGIAVALDAPLVYYAHTGNLDVPALFWITLALCEMDRVAKGEAREGRALLFSVFAVLTKDQAFAAVALPLVTSLVILPRVQNRPIFRRNLIRAALVAAVTFALISGAVLNASGFRKRLAFLVGPATEPWAQYPRGLHGTIDLTYHALLAIPRFTSWPIALAAFAGIAIVVSSRGESRVLRARKLLPLLASISFFLIFNVGARRTEERFLLPHAVFLSPYAAVVLDRAITRWPRARTWLCAIAAFAIAPAIALVFSVDATLLADPRYEAERYLASLPSGSRVEIYGGTIFLPRVPENVSAIRPGADPLGDRQTIPGVLDTFDPTVNIEGREPDVIVLGADVHARDADSRAEAGDEVPRVNELVSERDRGFDALVKKLVDGSAGYTRILRARCDVPWPLTCFSIHYSTGNEIWIYARKK